MQKIRFAVLAVCIMLVAFCMCGCDQEPNNIPTTPPPDVPMTDLSDQTPADAYRILSTGELMYPLQDGTEVISEVKVSEYKEFQNFLIARSFETKPSVYYVMDKETLAAREILSVEKSVSEPSITSITVFSAEDYFYFSDGKSVWSTDGKSEQLLFEVQSASYLKMTDKNLYYWFINDGTMTYNELSFADAAITQVFTAPCKTFHPLSVLDDAVLALVDDGTDLFLRVYRDGAVESEEKFARNDFFNGPFQNTLVGNTNIAVGNFGTILYSPESLLWRVVDKRPCSSVAMFETRLYVSVADDFIDTIDYGRCSEIGYYDLPNAYDISTIDELEIGSFVSLASRKAYGSHIKSISMPTAHDVVTFTEVYEDGMNGETPIVTTKTLRYEAEKNIFTVTNFVCSDENKYASYEITDIIFSTEEVK